MRDTQLRWREHLTQIQDSEALRQFREQLNREWAIETGRIENLYDIEQGVTVSLIEHGFEAALMPPGSVNRDPDYIVRLLNDQAEALEGLFAFVKQDRPLSVSYILELHQVMTASQASLTVTDPEGKRFETELLKGQWKKQPNYPQRDGREFRYCPPDHVGSEMDRLIEMHLSHVGVPPEVEAAWLHHRFTQIHPFQDGNGRIARALATLVLIRGGLFPMVVSMDDKSSYIEALERADNGDIRPFVLVIARGQQNRARTAMRVAMKSAPDSGSLREAIARYADVLGRREEAELAHLDSALRQAAGQIHTSCSASLDGALQVLKESDPGVNLSLAISAPEQSSERLRELARTRCLEVGALVATTSLEVVSRNHTMTVEIHTSYLTNTIYPEVVSFVVVRVGEDRLWLTESVRFWSQNELSGPGAGPELGRWLESTLTAAFDLGRRSV